MFSLCMLLNLSLLADPADELFVAWHVTESERFTSGIEGPACDADGNIFAVNFARQGTIGIVTPGGKPVIFYTINSLVGEGD